MCEALASLARASARTRKRKISLFLVLALVLASRFHACEPGVLRLLLRLLHTCEPGLIAHAHLLVIQGNRRTGQWK